MTHVDARGVACPLPVVKAKRAISELKGAGQVEILVDNEIAVQNLTKMAQQKGYQYSAEKLAEREYRVLFTIGEAPAAEETPAVCMPDARTDTVVAIGANTMGAGAEELGKTLLKAFVFALTQQDKLPKTVPVSYTHLPWACPATNPSRCTVRPKRSALSAMWCIPTTCLPVPTAATVRPRACLLWNLP